MLRVRQLRAAWRIEDVNLIFPALIAAAGIVIAATGHMFGLGILIGAIVAGANSALLLKRVQLAVESPSPAIATVSMQVGLMLTFVAIGAITLLLLVISVPLAVAMALTFFVAQTGEIGLFYWTRTHRSTPHLLTEERS
jgi:hypothetical protein